jgi:hypothetical protein
MNIQTHAYNLKCDSSVRFTKKDAPETLEQLYNATDDVDLREKLALLYSTMTPKTPVKNNPLAWVAIATDPKCDRNMFDKMLVTRGYAIGCDGYRIHAYKLPASQAADLEGQCIDANGNILDIKNNIPVDHMLKMLIEDEYPLTDTFDLSKCTVVAGGLLTKTSVEDNQFFDLELFGQKCRFNKKMIEQAFNGRQAVKVCTTNEFNGQQAVRFMLSDTETAVVMPVRIR